LLADTSSWEITTHEHATLGNEDRERAARAAD
jgi:hypothetical protein